MSWNYYRYFWNKNKVMYFACTFLVAHLCPKTYYVKRKNQNSLINQVKIWYLFLSINTHVYSPVTCYIMLCVPQDTIIPYCWIPIKCTIFSFHQLCSVLTFIMLLITNAELNWFYLMFIRDSLLSICKIEKYLYYISFVLDNGMKFYSCAQVYSHNCKCWTDSSTNENVYIIYTISRALQIFNNVQDCLALQSYIC